MTVSTTETTATASSEGTDRSSDNGAPPRPNKPITTLPSVTIRFAGDSGDGMQLAGTQFTDTSALVGNDISTLPDFPAEIRAPAGTLAGVSGYQVHFSSDEIFTPGDEVDALVAMNPAALKTNVKSVRPGDRMQVAGTQFADTSALVGNDISTPPDFPAEIRAPAGTLAGVSGYQVHFSSDEIFTPGDEVDALVAMNPAALKTNVKSVRPGGIVIVNEDAFTPNDLKKASYESNPIEDNSLTGYRHIKVQINKLNAAATKDSGLGAKDTDRCKNMFALGLVCWLYGRPIEPTLEHIQQKFGARKPAVALANSATLKAGYHSGETTELFSESYQVPKAKLPAGRYRKITGNEATALGMIAAGKLAGKELIYCSYPITPASDILHNLAAHKNMDVITFQAEDEIAAVGAAIGASFGGALGCTGTSGPGIALKAEAMGLAVMTELPLVVIDVQRGGPSTGLPTKTEQADLLQVLPGRNGECPLPVIAASSPSDCFAAIIEAFSIASNYL